MHEEAEDVQEEAEQDVQEEAGRSFRRGDHVELAHALLKAIGGDEPQKTVCFDEGILYRYLHVHGLWAPTSEDDCSRIIQTFAGFRVAARRGQPLCISASDIKGVIKCAQDQASARPGYFDDAPEGVSFSNGFVRVEAGGARLDRLTIENRARVGYVFPYTPNAETPLFSQFLADLFRGDVDANEKIAFLQEHAGISLLGRAPGFQVAALMVGGGDCGKSTFADIVMKCFPEKSIGSVTPQVMHKEYDRAGLVGKSLNYVAEMPEGDIVDGGPLKAIVVGDPISARQPFGRTFQFRSKAGQLLNANRLPGTNDQTHGFFRRFGIVEFNRSFTNDPTRDVNMANKIVEAERPQVASWLIAGAVRLLARGAYVLPASHAAAMRQWQMNVDQVRAFLADQTHPCAPGEKGTGASMLYARYTAWAEGNGHKPVSSTKLGVRLRELRYGSVHTKAGNRYPIAFGRAPSGGPGGDAGEGLVKGDPSPGIIDNLRQIRGVVK